MIILFPSDYFEKQKPDEMFANQVDAFQDAGFATATVSLEDLSLGKVRFHPNLDADETILYRGWMLSSTDYQALVNAVIGTGAKPFTNNEQYLLTHYIPNWYPLITDLTPKTACFTDLESIEEELAGLNWQGFFIKDFVKSLKTSVGSRIESPEEVNTVIAEMKKFRGQVEGGICVRQIEAINVESEKRYFVINGEAYSDDNSEIPNIVSECASRISSNFFSVDVVKRDDGNLRVIEVGDGQVSDLVGWSAERLVTLWSDVL